MVLRDFINSLTTKAYIMLYEVNKYKQRQYIQTYYPDEFSDLKSDDFYAQDRRILKVDIDYDDQNNSISIIVCVETKEED